MLTPPPTADKFLYTSDPKSWERINEENAIAHTFNSRLFRVVLMERHALPGGELEIPASDPANAGTPIVLAQIAPPFCPQLTYEY